jgi:hypothetical protein
MCGPAGRMLGGATVGVEEPEKQTGTKEKAMKTPSLLAGIVCSLTLVVGPSQAQAVESFFDVFPELTQGPPYPSTPPITVTVQNQIVSTGRIDAEIVFLSLQAVQPPSMPSRMTGRDSGGGIGSPGLESFFDVFVEIDVGDIPAESFFDVFFDMTSPTGIAMTLAKEPEPSFAESFFDVFFDTTVTDMPGMILTHHVTGQVGLGYELSDVLVSSPTPFVDSFFDVFFDITVTGVQPADPSQPVIGMTMTGALITDPALLPGDTQPDGCVDGLDYGTWSLNYLATGQAPWSAGGYTVGNFNEDDTVDGLDYGTWSLNYQQGCGPEAEVPEPACAVLLIAALGPLLFRRRSGWCVISGALRRASGPVSRRPVSGDGWDC